MLGAAETNVRSLASTIVYLISQSQRSKLRITRYPPQDFVLWFVSRVCHPSNMKCGSATPASLRFRPSGCVRFTQLGKVLVDWSEGAEIHIYEQPSKSNYLYILDLRQSNTIFLLQHTKFYKLLIY